SGQVSQWFPSSLLPKYTCPNFNGSTTAELCNAYGHPSVKPFVLVSTRDTEHAKEVRQYLESDQFEDGAYRGKVIEIHSKPNSKEESEENIARLLEVESPTSNVEVVVHVTMLKEGWDVTNLYTIVPLRASVSEILTEQTIGRGLRLPLPLTEAQVAELNRTDPEILRLSIVSHDKYEEILAAKKARADLFRDPIRDLDKEEIEALRAVQVQTLFSGPTTDILWQIARDGGVINGAELLRGDQRSQLVEKIMARSQEVEAAKTTATFAGTLEPGGIISAQVQSKLFPTAGEKAVPVVAEKVIRELRERIEKEVDALALHINVPEIRTYTSPKVGFTPFTPSPSSNFDLVEQRMRSADLKTGDQETGETLTLEEIDRPVAYLAAQLLEQVDEFDATEDKDRVLKLAGDYLAATGKTEDALRKLVHQYGHAMTRDLRQQVLSHLYDNTEVHHEVRAGFVLFKPFSKSIRQKDGEIDLREPLDQKSQIKRFLFGGIKKSIINRTGFDSDPERQFAIALEDDPDVLKWVRPPLGQTPIFCRGNVYNIDFIVETKTNRYLVEIKARGELSDVDVKEKARAAMRWCEVATEKQGGKKWSYAVIPDDVVSSTSTLAHMLAQAVKELSSN
ncbi:MAG: hypothetical protein HY284_07065, partial [Nitrospirae bacterium]|nr:hypothetical protein [Nitrospirota bacterium]